MMEAVRNGGELTETKVATQIENAVSDANNEEKRRQVALEARSLRLETKHSGVALSEVAVSLLAKGQPTSSIGTAVQFVGAIPPGRARARALSEAFERACERRGYRISKDEAALLAKNGVKVEKLPLKKRARDLLKVFANTQR